MKIKWLILLTIIAILIIPASVSAIDVSSTVSPTELTLGHGETEQITGTIRNPISECTITCEYSLIGPHYNYENPSVDEIMLAERINIGNIEPNSKETYTFSVTAPEEGVGVMNYQVRIYCTEYPEDSCAVNLDRSAYNIVIKYGADPNKQLAESYISLASSLIDDSDEQITSAQLEINNAKAIGADTTEAERILELAKSEYEMASSYLISARTALNAGAYIGASEDGESAQSISTSAKSKVEEAKTAALTAISDYETGQEEEQEEEQRQQEEEKAKQEEEKRAVMIKNGAIVAVIIAAIGGGLFAYKKLHKRRKKHKEEEKPKEKKKGKHCHNCGAKVKGNFCVECGEKVE